MSVGWRVWQLTVANRTVKDIIGSKTTLTVQFKHAHTALLEVLVNSRRQQLLNAPKSFGSRVTGKLTLMEIKTMSKYDLKPSPKERDEQTLLDVQDSLNNLAANLKGLQDNVTYLLNQIATDLTQRRKLRELERETLTRLNKYLEDWI